MSCVCTLVYVSKVNEGPPVSEALFSHLENCVICFV